MKYISFYFLERPFLLPKGEEIQSTPMLTTKWRYSLLGFLLLRELMEGHEEKDL